MGSLTEDTPKPMLKVLGKNLIEHKLEILPASIQEVVIVVGYKDHVIRDYFGEKWRHLPIKYVYQKELLGTGHGVHMAKDAIAGNFMVLMGDDMYHREFLDNLSKEKWAISARRIEKPKLGAKIVTDRKGTLTDIQEAQNLVPGEWENIGAYVLGKEFFDAPLVPKAVDSAEYGLPQTLLHLVSKYPIKIVEAENWTQITSPEDLQIAATVF